MLHPWHAKIHASCAADWTQHTPLSASLACGFRLSFYTQKQTLVVFGTLNDVREHILDIDLKLLPKNFADSLALLKATLNVEKALSLYHRVQRFLILQGIHGQWTILILREALYIEPVWNSTGQMLGHDFSEDLFPFDLRYDLLQCWDRYFPSFEDSACAKYGEFHCRVPSSAHQRLQILEHHTP